MQSNLHDWAPLPIRIAAGSCLAYRGGPELFTRPGHDNMAHLAREMGAPAPELMAWPLGGLQFFGGLALVAGTAVRPVAASVAGLWASHLVARLRQGKFARSLPGSPEPPGFEASLLYIGASAALVLTGAGRWSLARSRTRGM
jgi:putative oxidoreductase